MIADVIFTATARRPASRFELLAMPFHLFTPLASACYAVARHALIRVALSRAGVAAAVCDISALRRRRIISRRSITMNQLPHVAASFRRPHRAIQVAERPVAGDIERFQDAISDAPPGEDVCRLGLSSSPRFQPPCYGFAPVHRPPAPIIATTPASRRHKQRPHAPQEREARAIYSDELACFMMPSADTLLTAATWPRRRVMMI